MAKRRRRKKKAAVEQPEDTAPAPEAEAASPKKKGGRRKTKKEQPRQESTPPPQEAAAPKPPAPAAPAPAAAPQQPGQPGQPPAQAVPEKPKEPAPQPAPAPPKPKAPEPVAPQEPPAPPAPKPPAAPPPAKAVPATPKEPAPPKPKAAEPAAPKEPSAPSAPAPAAAPQPSGQKKKSSGTLAYGQGDTDMPQPRSPAPVVVESLSAFVRRDFSGRDIKGYYNLKRKLGAGGMSAVYFALEEHGKAMEMSKAHQNFYPTNRLLYYALNGRIDLRKLDIDEFPQGMKPKELKRAIHKKPGMVKRLTDLITSKGDVAAYKVLKDPDLADIVTELAIKVAPLTDQLRKRSKREAEIQGKASHPNIVGELFSGIEADTYYIGLEFVDELIKLDELQNSGVDLPPETCFMIAYYVLNVLVDLSEKLNVVHRDIKPGNILIGKEDFLPAMGGILVPFDTDQGRAYKPGIVKVSDLGLATYTAQDVTKLTETGVTLGTPAFMPPQRIIYGARHTRPSDDVFSLGQTLYYIITGELPFGSFDMEAIPLLNRIQDANDDPNFPSRVRVTRRKSAIHPFLESLVLEMLMKGTKEFLRRVHKKEFVEYREARPGPKHFLKKAKAVVDRIPDLYADISYEERHNKICEALQVDTRLSPEAKARIGELKAEINDAARRRDELIGRDETLHDMEQRFKVFVQEKRISHANYTIADLIPVSVEKQVDSPDGARYTRAVFLEWGIERHKRAVELIKRAWVNDICDYLIKNMGESAVNRLRNSMRNYLHIGESDLDPSSADGRNDQTVRLLEVLLARDVHLDESRETRAYIMEQAGSLALSTLLDSRDAFVRFKGERAYDTFIERMGVNEEMRKGMIAARGVRALDAVLESKEEYVALRGEGAYAKLIEPFRGEEDPHAKLVAALQDEKERKKFTEREGETYWDSLRRGGKERDAYIREEGEAALNAYMIQNGIDPKAADAYEQLCDTLRDMPGNQNKFVVAEGKIVYSGVMDRLAKYRDQTELDELILREQELTFELWMDQKLGRETATQRSTTGELPKLELDVDEDIFRVMQEHLNGILNGNPDYRGRRVRGYKELLGDISHPPTEAQLMQLNARMEEDKIRQRFSKIRRRFKLIEEEVTEEGIADSARPLYEDTKAQMEALERNLKVPEMLYDVLLKQSEGALNAELTDLEGRLKAIGPEMIETTESSRDKLAELKEQIAASADTIEAEYLPTYEKPEDRALVESYVAALRKYASTEPENDFYALEEAGNILKKIDEKHCFDAKSSLDLYRQIHELTEPLFISKRLEQVKADVARAKEKSLSTTQSEIGRCLLSLGMYDQANKYSENRNGSKENGKS